MVSWNSLPLEITYEVLGWIAFFCWTVGLYPQAILNYRRKSVAGFNFNSAVLNFTKHSAYLIYNATLYFSKEVQMQYYDKYGFAQMIPVATNDVAFSIHAVFLSSYLLFQIAVYARGDQKVSKITIAIVSTVWLSAAVCVIIALPTHSWLWLISVFNKVQVGMTLIKYAPQAYMNFSRKSTNGFSIGNISFDFFGGVINFTQMTVQSIYQGSWVNFSGNIGKLLLSMVSIFFDLIFFCQHYVLYPTKKVVISHKLVEGIAEPLLKPSSHPPVENV